MAYALSYSIYEAITIITTVIIIALVSLVMQKKKSICVMHVFIFEQKQAATWTWAGVQSVSGLSVVNVEEDACVGFT